MLLKGSSAARAGRLLQTVAGRAGYVESTPIAIRSLGTVSTSFNGRLFPAISGSSVVAVRTYADGAASRPKAHTGRATGTRKPRTTTATKTAAKAGTTKKRTTAAKAKPKPKPKPKKKKAVLSPEAKKRNEVRKLKSELLTPPKQLPQTAFLVISTELSKGRGIQGQQAATAYRNLSASERERYNHIANENKVKNESAYKRWLHSHPAVEVKRANAAGKRLVRLGARKRYTEVKDDRKPKAPGGPHSFFVKDRFASGDMAGVHVPDAMRLISREWKELSSSQKQKYTDESVRANDRYAAEIKRVYGS